MDEHPVEVLDYLAWKNKAHIADWSERLWRQHLHGALRDHRPDSDRQRWQALLGRIEQRRPLALKLYTRRRARTPLPAV